MAFEIGGILLGLRAARRLQHEQRGHGRRRGNVMTRHRRASSWEHAEAQHAVYLAPWFVFLLSGFVGHILHILYSTSGGWSAFVLVLVTLVTVGLGFAGWHDTHERTTLALAHTMTTIIVGGLWMLYVCVMGMIAWTPVTVGKLELSYPSPQRPVFDLYLLLGVGLCVMWNMRQGMRVNEARAAEKQGENIDDWTEAGFPGVTGKMKKINQYRSEGTLSLPKGVTLSQLQKSIDAIESAFDYPANSLTLLPHPTLKSSRKVKAIVVWIDPLEKPIAWPGVEF